MTKAGNLIHRIQIQRRVKVDNSRGEVVYSWVKHVNLRAEKNPLRGREFFEAAQVQSEITTRWRIHWRRDIDATMRVVELTGQKMLYDIKAPPIEVAGQRDWLDLMCSAGPQDDR
jgi:SPP1 family predicted phage head-tail adaptor